MKEEFYDAKNKQWDVNLDKIVTSILVETKNNSKYLNEYLEKVKILI